MLDNNQKQELISCINSRIESRKELIEKINNYFMDLKATGREWQIKMNIGKWGVIEISKPEVREETEKEHWWSKPKLRSKTRMEIDLQEVDKDGYIWTSKHRKYIELDYRDLLELSKKLDDILVNIGIIEDCKMNVGPVYQENLPPSKDKDITEEKEKHINGS